MGSSASRENAPAGSQLWQSETPVSFSAPFVDALQSSKETDSSRAHALELHIQSRVAAELQKIQEQGRREYEARYAKLAATEGGSEEAQAGRSGERKAGDVLRDLGRESVQQDVERLREKLEQRKTVREVDAQVQSAKSELVRCLRENDRRPLDCWREVEVFRNEVRRLEGAWVEKVVN